MDILIIVLRHFFPERKFSIINCKMYSQEQSVAKFDTIKLYAPFIYSSNDIPMKVLILSIIAEYMNMLKMIL